MKATCTGQPSKCSTTPRNETFASSKADDPNTQLPVTAQVGTGRNLIADLLSGNYSFTQTTKLNSASSNRPLIFQQPREGRLIPCTMNAWSASALSTALGLLRQTRCSFQRSQRSDHTAEIISKKAGKTMFTEVDTVSPHGRTLTQYPQPRTRVRLVNKQDNMHREAEWLRKKGL